MRIYTKSGDDGTTGLFGGERVLKTDARIECCGDIDEVNAAVGLCAAAGGEQGEELRAIQRDLFAIGAHLGTPEQSPAKAHLPALGDAMVGRLEEQIDRMDGQLRALTHFILPGGCEAAARLHMARTICRRAERAVVGLGQHENVPGVVVRYLNRLSDWLFVAARWANWRAGVEDVVWKGEG